MKLLFKTILIIIFLFALGCNNVYRDFEEIENLKWEKSDIKKFEVNIPSDGNYDLYFALRYITGYPYTNIKVNISETAADKTQMQKDCKYMLVNENREYLGDVAGDFWDFESLFSENQEMKKGEYIYEIKHAMVDNPLIMISDVGIIIRKSEKQ